MIRIFIASLFFFGAMFSHAQVKIGDNPNAINGSSLLELESTDKALVIPRVANTAAIASPVNGMLIYDLSATCIKSYENNNWTSCYAQVDNVLSTGTVSSLNCAGATASPSEIILNEPYTGTLSIPYDGAAGGFYNGESVSSTGVLGLTATLSAGGFGFGSGTVEYSLSGTPTSVGTASFVINFGGQTCTISLTVLNTPTFNVLIHNENSSALVPGGSSMSSLDDKLLNTANFGPGGTYNGNAVITYTSALSNPHVINAAVLANYDVYIVCYQYQISTTEATAVKNWVDNDGGVVIEFADVSTTRDIISGAFGVTLSGSSPTNPFTVSPASASHPIFSGPFGTLTSLTPAGSFGYYNSLPAGFTAMAYGSSLAAQPTVVSYDSGSAIFLSDEGLLRVVVSSGSGIGTGQADKLWGNIMAWAFDQVP